MDWTQIAGSLVKAGLPTLGGLIGGPAGAAIGSTVGPILADALGLPPDATPEDVGKVIEANPEAARQAERDRAADLRIAIEQAQTEQIRIVNETMRAELAQENWFIKGWRPACGWALGAIWLLHGVVIGRAMYLRDFEIIRAIADLTVFYGVMGGVTGVYAWRRTTEKITGVASAPVPDALAQAARAATKAITKGRS